MSVCVISGRYPETNYKSYINHKLYADKFGYSYIHCNWPTKERNPYLNKIHYILSYFDLYDYIIWIDDDAFFFDFDKDIMQFAPEGNNFISICKSPSFKSLKTFFSSGQFILKTDKIAKVFLEAILKQDISEVKNWWKDSLGYYSKGDQDIMIYLLHIDKNLKGRFKLNDYKSFNSRIENLFSNDIHTPLILHFTGKPKVKWQNYLRVQKKLNLHPSLVPKEILKKYKVKTKSRKNVFNKLKNKLVKWLSD